MNGGDATSRRRARRPGASSGTWVVDRSTQTTSPAFVRTLTHDLRSPATAARMGIGELTRRLLGDPENRGLALLVEEYAERAVAAADDATDLIALQAGAFAPSSCDFDLAALAEELLRDSRAKHVELVLDRPTRGCLVRGDFLRLRRVLSALVAEACLRARTTVKLELREEDDFACFQIIADGTFASPEQVDSLLEARHRPPTFRVGHGLGLRFAIARDIVAAQDGTIDVTVATGGCVRVTVRLPLL